MKDDLWWKTPYDGRRLMMEDDNEIWPQKQRELAHWWKAHSAGHILLCGIFLIINVLAVQVEHNLIISFPDVDSLLKFIVSLCSVIVNSSKSSSVNFGIMVIVIAAQV